VSLIFSHQRHVSLVEFSVLDLFDTLDSQLKKGSSSKKKSLAASFHRHSTWLEAHNYVVAAEKAKYLDDARTKTRLLAQAGIMGTENASGEMDGDLLDDDMDSVEMSDDDEGSSDGESDDESVADSVDSSDKEADAEGDSDNDSESDNESEESEDDDDFDHAAYIRQLQDEAFESELRKITNEALEKGKVSARTGAGGKVSTQMPAAPQFIAKKPTADDHEAGENNIDVPFGGGEGMSFKLLKRGNKGKMEEKTLVVPKSTNLARVATKIDDEAAKEHDLLKAKVLQYEADSADAGGNVYLDETKLEKNRNRKLTMETLDKNFGKSKPEAPYKLSERFRGRGPGRGGGRLFNPGRGRG
jgi:regulator of nonsense transcripts 2